ncbi:MAG: histidine kinase [Bacteroidetes bacterium]|nr:histidine kinase [Bacteroidota bacterium]
MEHRNIKLFGISGHVLVWLSLLVFPFLLASGDQTDFNRVLRFTWTPLIFSALIFYTNYLVFIDRFLFRKKLLLFVVINLSFIALSTWLLYEIKEFLRDFFPLVKDVPPGFIVLPKPSAKLAIYRDALAFIIPIVVSIAMKTTENLAHIVSEKQEKEKENLNTELQHLKYQLQPHFFFNALNTIYALTEQSPKLAQETIHTLSKLMRYMLYESDREKNNLADEIEFMNQYINLMKLRTSEQTRVHTNLPALGEHYKIAPLLFVSVIENAFKHGVSAKNPSELFFSLSVENNLLRFYAQNTNCPKNQTDKSGSGIGLANLRKRLELSYPDKHKFETKVNGNLFSALIEINLN